MLCSLHILKKSFKFLFQAFKTSLQRSHIYIYIFYCHILFPLSQKAFSSTNPHVAVKTVFFFFLICSVTFVLWHCENPREKNLHSEQRIRKPQVLHFLFGLKRGVKGQRSKRGSVLTKASESQDIPSAAAGPRRAEAAGLTGSEPELLRPDRIQIPSDQSFSHSILYRTPPRLCQRRSWTRGLCRTSRSGSSLYARTFRLRDTSPPRTPSSRISDKRPRLRLSGKTLRRWGYL